MTGKLYQVFIESKVPRVFKCRMAKDKGFRGRIEKVNRIKRLCTLIYNLVPRTFPL